MPPPTEEGFIAWFRAVVGKDLRPGIYRISRTHGHSENVGFHPVVHVVVDDQRSEKLWLAEKLPMPEIIAT